MATKIKKGYFRITDPSEKRVCFLNVERLSRIRKPGDSKKMEWKGKVIIQKEGCLVRALMKGEDSFDGSKIEEITKKDFNKMAGEFCKELKK